MNLLTHGLPDRQPGTGYKVSITREGYAHGTDWRVRAVRISDGMALEEVCFTRWGARRLGRSISRLNRAFERHTAEVESFTLGWTGAE